MILHRFSPLPISGHPARRNGLAWMRLWSVLSNNRLRPQSLQAEKKLPLEKRQDFGVIVF
jgi:hypothetical protein